VAITPECLFILPCDRRNDSKNDCIIDFGGTIRARRTPQSDIDSYSVCDSTCEPSFRHEEAAPGGQAQGQVLQALQEQEPSGESK